MTEGTTEVVTEAKAEVSSIELFRSALISAIKAKKTQTQFANEFAAVTGKSPATIKQRYIAMVRELRERLDAETKAGNAESTARLNKAIEALKFADGRKKENGGGQWQRGETSKSIESLTDWLADLESDSESNSEDGSAT